MMMMMMMMTQPYVNDVSSGSTEGHAPHVHVM